MKKVFPLLILILLVGCNCHEVTQVQIIPQPVELTVNKGCFELNQNVTITYADPSLEGAATYLQTVLSESIGAVLPLSQNDSGKNGVFINVDETLSASDAYKLTVTADGIRISGANPKSAMLGIQTLRQLIPMKATTASVKVQSVDIYDEPLWGWRGMMLDVARHFHNKDEVKKFLDIMAMYKFNKFHWHLTDDQGWRIEIKKYPLLTEKGGWRQFNKHDLGCLKYAETQSNTDYLLQKDKLRNENEYGGYYTQEEIKEVVAYAAMLGIDVIPEIDMPGHFSAAIQEYPNLACFDKAGWGEIFSAPICPGKNTTLEFCKDVYAEVFELFPYEYVHLGADEVEKHNWKKCPNCQKRIKENKLKDEKELQSWFVHQMEDYFIANNKKMIGWDEILEGGMSETATMMWWRTWAKDAVHRATAQGNEVILTPNSHFYFDYQQHPTTLRALYEFQPLPANLTAEQKQLIKGIQANVWEEWIPSIKRMEYMTMPRMLALSELAWSKEEGRNWDNFLQRLVAHFERMDVMGINYRPLDLVGIHTNNVFVGQTTVVWNHPLAHIAIHYTTDGSVPTKESTLYTGPFDINETTDFTIRFFRPDGSAADIVKTSYRKEEYAAGQEPGNKQPGLICEWHEGVVNKCAKIEELPVKEQFIIDNISIPSGVTNHKQAMKYHGFLKIEKEGIYTFTLGSDDGSMFYINNEVVVDNDGAHGPVTLAGQKALSVGYHPFVLYYFDMNNGGFVKLQMTDANGEEITPVFAHNP